MYTISDIRVVHLEITSKCNATCPLCPRTVSGGKLNPNLPITELSLENIQSVFPENFVKSLTKLYMCGNHGDPAAAEDSLRVFKWLREVNPNIFLEIYSNGGIRSKNYWTEMAKVVNRARFAIDGLKDTNHIYRKGVVWERVEANVKAFLAAGGVAQWDFIVFQHNEHQVGEVKKISQKWGVQELRIKKTGRFFNTKESTSKCEQVVLNKKGELDYKIYLPKNPKYINPALLKELQKEGTPHSGEVAPRGKLKDYLESSPVDCKSLNEKSIFLSASGYVFPCCWLGLEPYLWNQEPKSDQLSKLLAQVEGGMESLNAVEMGVERVLDGEFFQQELEKSWDLKKYTDGKLRRCAKTCGRKDFDLLKSQLQ